LPEERAQAALVRRDPLDLGEGDIVSGALDGSMKDGRAIPAAAVDQEIPNTGFGG